MPNLITVTLLIPGQGKGIPTPSFILLAGKRLLPGKFRLALREHGWAFKHKDGTPYKQA
jgi:hypothetical protein